MKQSRRISSWSTANELKSGYKPVLPGKGLNRFPISRPSTERGGREAKTDFRPVGQQIVVKPRSLGPIFKAAP